MHRVLHKQRICSYPIASNLLLLLQIRETISFLIKLNFALETYIVLVTAQAPLCNQWLVEWAMCACVLSMKLYDTRYLCARQHLKKPQLALRSQYKYTHWHTHDRIKHLLTDIYYHVNIFVVY